MTQSAESVRTPCWCGTKYPCATHPAESVVYCPFSSELYAYVKDHPWDFTGRCRISLGPDNVLNIEILHDCFLLNCDHYAERHNGGKSA